MPSRQSLQSAFPLPTAAQDIVFLYHLGLVPLFHQAQETYELQREHNQDQQYKPQWTKLLFINTFIILNKICHLLKCNSAEF